MKVIGITGTKGKTTVAHMIYEILKASGRKVGLIGTLEYIIGDEHRHSPFTCPEAKDSHLISAFTPISVQTISILPNTVA